MKPIPEQFIFDKCLFTMLDRKGDFCLYERKKPGDLSYEVVKVQKYPAHTWPNGDTTEAHEAYPGNEQWGTNAWTFTSASHLDPRSAAKHWLEKVHQNAVSLMEVRPNGASLRSGGIRAAGRKQNAS